jgi:hypothetical protein
MEIAPEPKGKPQVSVLQCVMIYDEHIAFNAGRTFLSDHFAGKNARVTLSRPKRLMLRVTVANLAGKQNIKKSEEMEWFIEDRNQFILKRVKTVKSFSSKKKQAST